MKLQDQVCTLEQAKKLKELGVIQDSIFCFIGDGNPDPKYFTSFEIYYSANAMLEVGASWHEHRIAAFTVAELGIMLPSETLTIRRGSESFPNWEWENEGRQTGWGCFNTEAAARADHLIMLLENKLITVEEVNKRLK